MRRCGACLLILLSAGTALAGGWAKTYELAGGTLALTNEQANTGWVPVALLWRWNAATNSVVTVERVSQGHTYLLGATTVSNATSAVWVPDADFPFAAGDVLRVGSTATNGVVQVIRKGD